MIIIYRYLPRVPPHTRYVATYQGPAKSTAWQPSGGGGGFSGRDLIWLIRGSTPKMRYLDHHETSAGDLEVNKTEDSVPRTDPVLTKSNFQRLWTCFGWLVKQLVKSYDCLWWSQSKKASSQNCFLVCFRWHVPKKTAYFCGKSMESHGIPTWQGKIPRRIVIFICIWFIWIDDMDCESHQCAKPNVAHKPYPKVSPKLTTQRHE